MKALDALLLIFIVPLFILIKLIVMPFERRMKRSPEEMARYLRGFLEETGGDWDWDDFISIEIADPRLESLRERAAMLPMPDPDTEPLRALVAEAEAIAASDKAATLKANAYGARAVQQPAAGHRDWTQERRLGSVRPDLKWRAPVVIAAEVAHELGNIFGRLVRI